MSTIEARYTDGSSVKVDAAESVGDIMFYLAKACKRFASDVVVTRVDTGENLCDFPSQTPPLLVQVVVKRGVEYTIEELLLTLRLHSKREDKATCEFAFTLLKWEFDNTRMDNGEMYFYQRILVDVLEKEACGDAKIEGNILRTLIGVGANANYFLQEAAANGNEGRVRMLLADGVPVERLDDSSDIYACDIQALSAAAWGGRRDIVDILLSHNADVNWKGHVHETPSIAVCDDQRIAGSPLTLSCHNGHVDVVEMLIDHKADVNQSFMFTWPLHAACTQRRLDVVSILLSRKADVNYALPDSDLPIMQAAKHGDVDIAKLLVSHKSEVQFFDSNKYTPVLAALRIDDDSSSANYSGKIEVLKLLLARKASANVVNAETLETALISAVTNEKMKDAVKVLLHHKANVNADVFGLYPLQFAANKGDVDIVKLLLSHKADLNLKDAIKDAIAVASKQNHKAVVELLEPLTTRDTLETGILDPSKKKINDILKDLERRQDEVSRRHYRRVVYKLPAGDETYEEMCQEVEDNIFLTVQYKHWKTNEERRTEGKKPYKLGKRFLHRMKELVDDETSDVVCTCKSRRKEN